MNARQAIRTPPLLLAALLRQRPLIRIEAGRMEAVEAAATADHVAQLGTAGVLAADAAALVAELAQEDGSVGGGLSIGGGGGGRRHLSWRRGQHNPLDQIFCKLRY